MKFGGWFGYRQRNLIKQHPRSSNSGMHGYVSSKKIRSQTQVLSICCWSAAAKTISFSSQNLFLFHSPSPDSLMAQQSTDWTEGDALLIKLIRTTELWFCLFSISISYLRDLWICTMEHLLPTWNWSESSLFQQPVQTINCRFVLPYSLSCCNIQ